MSSIQELLRKPFPPEDIQWRVQHAIAGGNKAIVLAYIDSRAVMDRLDEVFGIDGWQDHYERWNDKGVKCTLSVKINDQWISKQDGADDTNIEATKGGISDALKRAAVKWGIGRYLYNLSTNFVDLRDSGEIYAGKIKEAGGKPKYFDPPTLPAWALPEGYQQKPKPVQQPANQPNQTKPKTNGKITESQLKKIFAITNELKADQEKVKEFIYSRYNVSSSKQLTKDQASELINLLNNKLEGVA